MSSNNKPSKVVAVLAVAFSLLAVAVLMMSSTHAQASPIQRVKVPAPVPTSPSTAVPPGATPTATPGVPGPVPTGIPANCTLNFSDVQPTDWFFPYVQWIVCNNIAGGYNDGTFRPNNNTTRAQASKIIVLASRWQLVSPPAPTFSDVPVGSTFYSYIETAVQHNILTGYNDGTFRPGNSVTRGQFSKLAVLARGWALDNPVNARFTDVPVGSTFFQYVETAAAKGVLGGYNDGTFRPGNNATRAQMSKMVELVVTTR